MDEVTNEITFKEIIIALLVAASGVANAYFWKQLIFSPAYTDVTLFSAPAATLFLFAILFSLLSLFGKSGILGFSAIAVAFIGSFLFIPAGAAAFLGIALALSLSLLAFRRIRTEARIAVFFGLSKILRQGLPLFFTTLAFVVSVFYFSSIALEKDQTILPRSVFEFSLPFLQNTLQGMIPGFRAAATVDELLLEAARSQLGAEVDISKVPKSQLEKLLAEERQSFSQGLGIKITGKEKAADLIYELANQKIEDFAGPYKQYLPYLTAFGFFLAVKVLTLPLYFITLGLLWLAVQLLLSLGVLKKETVTIQAEKVIL